MPFKPDSTRRSFFPSPVAAAGSFLIGTVTLRLSGDAAIVERFATIFGDCAIDRASAPILDCQVEPSGSLSLAYDGDRLDLATIVRNVNATREHSEPRWSVAGDTVTFDTAAEWRGFAANVIVNAVIALQPDVWFFHAASVAVAGRGALLAGVKCSGKSTLSLALAGRGNDMLGDEMAALTLDGYRLLPVRRAASIRPGIRAEAVDRRLAVVPGTHETYPDGALRTRVRLSDLFPGHDPRPTPLRAIFFLRQFSQSPAATRFTPSLPETTLVQPIGGDWQSPRRRFKLLQMLSAIPCFHLDAAAPDETAAFIETTLEAL